MHLKLRKLYRTIIVQLLLFFPIALIGQSLTSVKITDSLQVSTPSPIPVIDVIGKISATNNELKIIEGKIILTSDYTAIDSLFPIFQQKIHDQKLSASQFIKASPNRQKIDNLISKWLSEKSTLTSWLSDINGYKKRNLRFVESVTFNEKTWALTYENAKDEEVPYEVSKRILDVWNRTKVIKSDIQNENNEFLRLESKINLQIAVIDNVIDELMSLKDSEVYELFYLRHLPLWSTSFTKSEKQNESDIVDFFDKNIKRTSEFFKNNSTEFNLYFIIIIIITFVFLYIKKGFKKYEYTLEDPNLKIARVVIVDHTVACIIFLALIIANLGFIGKPELIKNTISLLMLLAATQVIKPNVSPAFKSLAYFVVFFFILDAAKTFVWFNSAWYRVYLLIESVFVIGVIYYFIYPYSKTRLLKLSKLSMTLVRLTPVFYGLVIISIISNILGYTNLTDLTLKICTQSGVITLIFYGILLVTEGLSTGIIHLHFGIRSNTDHVKKLYIEQKLLKTLRVVVFLLWCVFFLGLIDQLNPIVEFLNDALAEPYEMGSLSFTLGSILTFGIILFSSYVITKFISFILDDGQGVLKFLKLPKGVPAAISLVIRYFIIAFGFVLALSSLGINLSKFNLMAGALGVGIGFGLQTVISNFISGLILVFERPILPGDTVEVNNLLGKVSRIGIRSSSIRTFDGAEVIVPNNNLIANDLINWTLSDSVKRVEILIGTTYDANPNDVLKILFTIANDFPDILKDPPPLALFSNFGDSSLNFRLLFWVPYEIGLQIKSDVSIEIYNRFEEANIEIPFPQRDIHIKSMPNTNALESGD